MGLVDEVYQEQSNKSLVDEVFKGKKPSFELPFEAKHPALYATGRTIADLIPFGKYAFEEERKEFGKLKQQEQTRRLLEETAEAELFLGFPRLLKGTGEIVGGVTERFFPKTHEFFTKPLGKIKPEIKPIEEPIITEPPIKPKETSLVDQVLETTTEDPLGILKPEEVKAEPITPKPTLQPKVEVTKPLPAAKAEVGKEPWDVMRGNVDSALDTRRVKGDTKLDAVDLADELAEKGAEIDNNGFVTLYHRTTKANAEKIVKTGQIISKEDRIFFGTHPEGQIEGYGDTVIKTKLPLEKLELSDVFSNEAHVTLKSGRPGTPVRIKSELWTPEVLKDYPDLVKPLEPLAGEARKAVSKYELEIRDLKEQVNIGEAGKRTLNAKGEPVVTQSTYPSWMQNKGWTKQEVLGAIDKGLEGKPLGVKQQEIFNAVKQEARNQYAESVKLAQEKTIRDISTGELEVGDKVRVKGETLKVTEKTPEKIIIEDGQKFELDPYFDKITGKKLTPTKTILPISKSAEELLNENLIRPKSHGYGVGRRWEYRAKDGMFTVAQDKETAIRKANEALQAKPKPEGVKGGGTPKTISQFTEEYKGGMGEAGYITIGGKEITPTPKVVTAGTRDVALPEFGLGTLHVADRHPLLKPIIEANIKAEQNTNDWILRYSDRINQALDKVEKPGLFRVVFGRKGTAIRDLDSMIEGKKPIPTQLSGFVTDIKGILGEIKGEIIQKMKNDFTEFLSPKQKEYLDWVQSGKIGDKPKYVRTGTIKAVDEAFGQFKEMEKWGVQDYFPHIFKGRYKYLNENGGIVAGGQTAKQAKANFEEFIESHPEVKDQTFMFVNDFYDLMTVRKVLNPELTNPLEYLGTRLSRKEFFRLVSKTEKVIKEEIASAGVADIPKVKVDMSGIASFQKGTKFSGHFLGRKTSLRGEETDPFRALMSYVFSVGRKLGLEDAKKASYAFSDSLPLNMPNAKSYIKMQADNMAGRYNIIDRLFDETIGEKLGMKPFGVTRIFAKGVELESKLKLGYAPAKTAINRIGGIFHTILKEGGKNYIAGKNLLRMKNPDLLGRIEKEGHLAGMEQLFAGEGLIGVSEKQTSWWKPLGRYQKAEIKNRTEALAAGYVSGLKKFAGDKDAAWIYAVDSTRLTQGLYNLAAKPVVVRGPLLQSAYQFKQYLSNEVRFMSQLTPAQWAGYIPGMVALAGTRGALLTIKSIIGIGLVGVGLDKVMEKLNRKAPHLHRGVFGLVGIDVSAPASWQIPSSVKDWIGVFPRDILETGEMIIKGLQNNGWTDEQINDYVRQIAPVGYNIFKGLQILSEGATKEGTKVIYRGGKGEGVFNLLGAKSVKQSQASDSARYMNQQRQLILERTRVLEDKLFRANGQKELNDIFKELIEIKNIQTSEEMQDFVNGLRKSALSRRMTEEARIFLTLPKGLKKTTLQNRG